MATQDINDLSVTWNSGGTTFTGVKLNVTNTASASASMLMDLQVGGSSKFKVVKNGAIGLDDNIYLHLPAGNALSIGLGATDSRIMLLNTGSGGYSWGATTYAANGGISWTSSNNNPANGSADVGMTRNAAGDRKSVV